jgi:leader peptidase (prepilin peptidase) / N-methyltransferase
MTSAMGIRLDSTSSARKKKRMPTETSRARRARRGAPPEQGRERQQRQVQGQGRGHAGLEEGARQRVVVIQVLPGGPGQQSQVGGGHRDLGAQVVEPAHLRGLHPRGRAHVGEDLAGRPVEAEQRPGDEQGRRRQGQEPGQPPPVRAAEEARLEKQGRRRQGEGDLLGSHRQQRRRQRQPVGEAAAPRPGARLLLAEAPGQVEQQRRQVEEGGERGEPLDQVAHRLGLDGMGDEERRGGEGHGPGGAGQRRAGEARRPEGEGHQRVDQEGVGQVDGEVHRVVAGDLQPPQAVVQGEGEVGDEAVRVRPVPGAAPQVVAQVPDERVVPDLLEVVVEEGAPQGVGVGEEAEQQDRRGREQVGSAPAVHGSLELSGWPGPWGGRCRAREFRPPRRAGSLAPVRDLAGIPQALVIAWAVALGAAVGSFLNVVVARVPAGLSVVWPRSRCPRCLAPIAATDNVPVLSWLLLRGRCRSCAAPISVRYPLVELAGAAAAWLALSRHGLAPAALAELLLVALVLALGLIDLDSWLLPHALTWPLLLAGLGLSALGLTPAGALRPAYWGAGVGFAAFAAVAALGRVAFKREALGFGDVWLLAGLGAWLGVKSLLPLILLASLQGTAVGLWLAARGRLPKGAAAAGPTAAPTPAAASTTAGGEEEDWTPPRNAIPFGPFLVAGALEWLYLGGWLARHVPTLEIFR